MPSGYRLGAAHHVGHLGSGLVPCQAAGQGGSVWTLRGAGLPLHPRSNFFPEQSPTTKTQDCSQAPGAGMGTTVKPRTLPTDVCPPCPQHSVHPKSSRALGAMARERAGGTPAAPTRVRVSHGSWLLYSSIKAGGRGTSLSQMRKRRLEELQGTGREAQPQISGILVVSPEPRPRGPVVRARGGSGA